MSTIQFDQEFEELSRKVDSILDTIKSLNRNDSIWIDKEEVLKILKCSDRTLQTLRDNKKIGFTRPLGGSKFFYRRKDVMALFENNFTEV